MLLQIVLIIIGLVFIAGLENALFGTQIIGGLLTVAGIFAMAYIMLVLLG